MTNLIAASVIIVNPGHDIDELKQSIETLAASSPNCAEVLSAYKGKGTKETVSEIKVKWSAEGRDKQLFPKETILTEDNCEPVLRMMAVGVGKDVFDVKLVKSKEEEPPKEGAKKEVAKKEGAKKEAPKKEASKK